MFFGGRSIPCTTRIIRRMNFFLCFRQMRLLFLLRFRFGLREFAGFLCKARRRYSRLVWTSSRLESLNYLGLLICLEFCILFSKFCLLGNPNIHYFLFILILQFLLLIEFYYIYFIYQFAWFYHYKHKKSINLHEDNTMSPYLLIILISYAF